MPASNDRPRNDFVADGGLDSFQSQTLSLSSDAAELRSVLPLLKVVVVELVSQPRPSRDAVELRDVLPVGVGFEREREAVLVELVSQPDPAVMLPNFEMFFFCSGQSPQSRLSHDAAGLRGVLPSWKRTRCSCRRTRVTVPAQQ